MAFVMKPSSRYSSYDSRSSTSSHFSDPSSSTEFIKRKSPLPANNSSSSRALVKSKPSDISKLKSKPSDPNFTTMVKKFMEKRSNSSSSKTKVDNRVGLVIPSDIIAEDLKKTARKGSNFGTLHKKLFGKGTSSSEKEKKEVKALTEVEKLKDLCLKQREEIKSLKNAILFPDAINSQLQDILEKQDSELKQAKHLIPTLQRQVTSLTGQLQCIADDLAEVKADKYSGRTGFQNHNSSPRTPTFNHDDASNSLEFSSEDQASPCSPDDMLLKDLNPCLTPYYAKTRSKEFEGMGYDSPQPQDESLSENKMEFGFNSFSKKFSRSSDCCQSSKTENTINRAARRSDETKLTYGKQKHHKLF
ncbi:hypothetical protein G4B88_010585 [Cannabis sativa]|uniref:Uncharacterized protein n=1 Tax=Cannabis sativa TaxID=3483 RepID=A0A7J6G893_CANSA|nr:hypothetical protein G4B88_010585 [Cannabis sativa]